MKVITSDCFTFLSEIPSSSIDFICIDPPFGMTALEWDSCVPFDKLWSELGRVIKPEGVTAIFAAQPFTTKVIVSNIKDFKYCWYWNKNQGTNFFHAKRMPIRKVEEICIFGGKTYNPQITSGHVPTNAARGKAKGKVYHGRNDRDDAGGKTTRYPSNILEHKCVDNYSRLHPNQKPVELLEYLIKTYTSEGDTVLDCFAGVGSTMVAAHNTSRKWIGCEREVTYTDIANNRIQSHL